MWQSMAYLRLATVSAALLACSPLAADTLLIGNKGENTVSFVDLESGQERARVSTGSAPHEIARRLVQQVTGTVRWRECVSYMAGAGVTTFYEVGSGKVLTGLLKRIAEGATGTAIGTPEDVTAYKPS